jgi:hypothetical protein
MQWAKTACLRPIASAEQKGMQAPIRTLTVTLRPSKMLCLPNC